MTLLAIAGELLLGVALRVASGRAGIGGGALLDPALTMFYGRSEKEGAGYVSGDVASADRHLAFGNIVKPVKLIDGELCFDRCGLRRGRLFDCTASVRVVTRRVSHCS